MMKNMRRWGRLGGLVLFLGLFGIYSFAHAVGLDSVSCSWGNVVGGVNVNFPALGDPCEIRWGTDIGNGQSGLSFDGITPPPIAVPLNTDFVLGTLTHFNVSIGGNTAEGDAPSSADLDITINFTDPSVSPGFTFSFSINETANDLSPCPAGDAQPCADIISFPGGFPVFAFDGLLLEIVGFEQGGSIFDQFVSDEGQQNSAALVARITAQILPEPTSLFLLGVGLLGFALLGRVYLRRP